MRGSRIEAVVRRSRPLGARFGSPGRQTPIRGEKNAQDGPHWDARGPSLVDKHVITTYNLTYIYANLSYICAILPYILSNVLGSTSMLIGG